MKGVAYISYMKIKRFSIIVAVILFGCFLIFSIGNLYVNIKTNKLIKAIHQDDINEALELISDNKQSVNSLSSCFPTLSVMLDDSVVYPLQEACNYGEYEIVQTLIEYGADVNCVDPTIHSTPLIMTLRSNNQNRFEIADFLIDNGADIIVATDDHNENVLSASTWLSLNPNESEKEASKQMFIRVLSVYIQEEIDIKNIKCRCGNVYLTACSNGNVEVIKYLLDNNFYEINETSQDSKTALMIAVQSEKIEVVEYLIDNGANTHIVDANGNSAYYYAIESHNDEIIRLLDKFD